MIVSEKSWWPVAYTSQDEAGLPAGEFVEREPARSWPWFFVGVALSTAAFWGFVWLQTWGAGQ